MKSSDMPDYEYAWRKYLTRNPETKRFFMVWDLLSLQRRRDVTALARALVREDKETKPGVPLER